MFHGSIVALSPRSATARSTRTTCKLVDWHVEQGTDCLARRHHRRVADADHDEHERVIAAVGERAARPHQGHGRHRLEQHRARPSA